MTPGKSFLAPPGQILPSTRCLPVAAEAQLPAFSVWEACPMPPLYRFTKKSTCNNGNKRLNKPPLHSTGVIQMLGLPTISLIYPVKTCVTVAVKGKCRITQPGAEVPCLSNKKTQQKEEKCVFPCVAPSVFLNFHLKGLTPEGALQFYPNHGPFSPWPFC